MLMKVTTTIHLKITPSKFLPDLQGANELIYQNNSLTTTKSKTKLRLHHSRDILPLKTMMTSSNGNIFRVIGHLCGEFTGCPVNFPHKGRWRGALMFSLICARINGSVNNREAGDLRCHPTHCAIIVMLWDVMMASLSSLDDILSSHDDNLLILPVTMKLAWWPYFFSSSGTSIDQQIPVPVA